MQRKSFALSLTVFVLLSVALVLTACGGTTADTTVSEGSTATLAPTTTLVPGSGDWPVYHHDAARSGISDDQEPLGEVTEAWTSPDFGNFIYAQPLVVGDRVIVATEGNNVYSLNAATGGIVWQTALGAPVDGSTLPCGNINPSGITGAPAIDTETGTIYVVAFLSDGPHHQLYALDLETGAIQWDRLVDPPGLSATVEQERGALSLSGGMVYIPFGGMSGDCGQYRGAVVGVPADNNGASISYEVPTERMGGIWNMTGVPIDGAGDLWVATGNTASRSTFDYGNAVIRLSPELQVLDYFAPADWVDLNAKDLDINTTAPVLLDDGRVLIAGKNTTVYLLDAADLGQIGGEVSTVSVGSPAFGTAIVQGSRVFVPTIEQFVAVDISGDQLSIAWKAPWRASSPIMAAGTIWTVGVDGVVRGTDPTDGTQVYSQQITAGPTQFATLSAANGRLFVIDGTKILALNLR